MDSRQTFLDTDFSKAFAGFTLPGFDVEAALASQRKNIEALTQANQLAVEGVQAVARRQVEIAREAIDEVSTVLRDIVQPTAPEERIAKQAELLKQTFERSLANTRELALMLAKANTEAFDVVAKRVAQGFEEIRDEAKKRVTK
ncbi:MAG: TIGR01841 family phasin [Alphaproteobacteria bacterium]|nr:TIGR01841 family phasin [Alphaproteobacteria bacterium]MDE1968485.1 TIGR01841 family phasin [Alphaproteobacteria bacterium]MDE2512774.1 TIGR01841 family phasin [Alphaproteobacteria bacterium]